MKKYLSIALMVSLMMSAAGCGTNQDSKQSDQITLKWVMPGPGEQKDSQRVWAKFNEELKKYDGMENVNVDIEVIQPSDYAQKFMLKQTSGETMDLIQTYSLDWVSEARNGAFMDISDEIRNLASYKELPEWLWEYGQIDGKQYLLPNYQQMVSALYGFRSQKKLADEYMDKEKLQNTILSDKYFTSTSYEAIEEYLKTLADAGKLEKGYNGGNMVSKGYETIVSTFGIDIYDDTCKVVNLRETQNYKDYAKYMWEWNQKGYISEDALTVTASDYYGKEKGGYTVWMEQMWKGWENKDFSNYGLETTGIALTDHAYLPRSSAAGGMAVYANSKYPEQALRLMDLMNSKEGEYLYNLVSLGIEGEHYTWTNKETNTVEVKRGAGAVSQDAYGLWQWVVGNIKNAYNDQYDSAEYRDYIFNELNESESTMRSKLLGFQPDITKVKTQVEQVNTINGEYGKTIGAGAEDDWQSLYDECIKKMNDAGAQDIINELQRQVDEFLKK